MPYSHYETDYSTLVQKIQEYEARVHQLEQERDHSRKLHLIRMNAFVNLQEVLKRATFLNPTNSTLVQNHFFSITVRRPYQNYHEEETDQKNFTAMAKMLADLNEAIDYCVAGFESYTTAYTSYIKKLPLTVRLFGSHGYLGLKRAEATFKSFQHWIGRLKRETLNQSIFDLMRKNQFTPENVNALYKKTILQLLKFTKAHLANMSGGNLDKHSYRTYLIAFIHEFERAVQVALHGRSPTFYEGFVFKMQDADKPHPLVSDLFSDPEKIRVALVHDKRYGSYVEKEKRIKDEVQAFITAATKRMKR